MFLPRKGFTTESPSHGEVIFLSRLLRAVVVPGLIFIAFATASHAQIHFRDITAQAGIHFVHNNGAFGEKWLPETMGPGCAFIDYDNDGYPDILLINGEDFPGHPRAGATTLKLYHNNHDGTFTDVTRQAGLAVAMYGLGVAVGDYDNDGFDDIFVTALGQSRLFHNNGNGTFTDVTKSAGMWGPNEFSASAAWVDYDRDGKLDLVVANYVQWSEQTDLYCTLDGAHKSYCTPESYKGASLRLWHNLGGGKFEDTTRKAGLGDPTSKSLGVAILDYNGDGWPGHSGGQRYPAQQALPEQGGWNVQGARSFGRHWLQRGWHRARGHGRGRRRLRPQRACPMPARAMPSSLKPNPAETRAPRTFHPLVQVELVGWVSLATRMSGQPSCM